MKERVVVTGGAGFIGSHIVDLLVGNDYEVLVLDNLLTGSKENIREHLENEKIEFCKADIRDLRELRHLLKDCDFVIHCAAIASIPTSFKNPKLTFEVNLKGTLNVAKACIHNHINFLFFASSSSVYGNPEYIPIDETHPLNPTSPYAQSKISAEKSLMWLAQSFNLNIIVFRIFNVYGERQREGVVANFIRRVRKGLPPIIYGDGNQTRDFIYVKDVARVHLLAIKRGLEGFNIFNIGSGKEVRIKELAKMIIEISGKELEPLFEPERKGDIRRSVADISLVGSELGFQPKYMLYSWLRETFGKGV